MSVSIKSAREIALMREACRIIATVHEELGKELKPGMSTLDVDRKAEEMIRSASAWSFRARAAAAKGIRLMVTG